MGGWSVKLLGLVYLSTTLLSFCVGCSDKKGKDQCAYDWSDGGPALSRETDTCGDNVLDGEFYRFSDAGSLDELAGVTFVKGRLIIGDSVTIQDLDVLNSLMCAGDNFTIKNNAALANLDGLSNLAYVGGDLEIVANPLLANLDGLGKLTEVAGAFKLGNLDEGNPALANLDGLSSLTNIGDYLWIEECDSLAELDGLSNLETIGGHLGIFANGSLENLDGLRTLTSVGGFLNIAENEKLPTCEAIQLRDGIGTECRDICVRSNLADDCQNDDEGCWYDRCAKGDECDNY